MDENCNDLQERFCALCPQQSTKAVSYFPCCELRLCSSCADKTSHFGQDGWVLYYLATNRPVWWPAWRDFTSEDRERLEKMVPGVIAK